MLHQVQQRSCKLFCPLTGSSSKPEWSIAHHHPWHLPSPVLQFWDRSWIQGKRRKCFPISGEAMISKIFPIFLNAKWILWCLVQTRASSRQWMGWTDAGGHIGIWEWGLLSVCIQALLLFLASSSEQSIDCDPTPNLSLFWSTTLPSFSYSKSPVLMVSSLHS